MLWLWHNTQISPWVILSWLDLYNMAFTVPVIVTKRAAGCPANSIRQWMNSTHVHTPTSNLRYHQSAGITISQHADGNCHHSAGHLLNERRLTKPTWSVRSPAQVGVRSIRHWLWGKIEFHVYNSILDVRTGLMSAACVCVGWTSKEVHRGKWLSVWIRHVCANLK